MRPARVCALMALLTLPAAARAEQFRYKFTSGQVTRTRASLAGATMMGPSTGSMMKMQFRQVLSQVERVRSFSGGVATLEITETPISGHTSAMGRTEPIKKTPSKSVVRLSDRGRVVGHKETVGRSAEDAGGDSNPLDALYGLDFPQRDLKPGDTWTDVITTGSGEKAQKVQLQAKFVGWTSFKGKRCAQFSTTLSMSGLGGTVPASVSSAASGKVSGTINTYFDPVAGAELYSRGSVTILGRVDLSGASEDAGEFATVTRINFVQSQEAAPSRKR